MKFVTVWLPAKSAACSVTTLVPRVNPTSKAWNVLVVNSHLLVS